MSAARAKKSRAEKPKAKPSRVKAAAPKKKSKPARAGKSRPKTASPAPQNLRPFRFTAADTVKIHFKGEKRPEDFRVDDMVEATIATLDGQTRRYYQYRLVSTGKQNGDGSDRSFWFLDPMPVGAADPVDPSLWKPVGEHGVDGLEAVKSCSGNFSTRSVTSYDGSGVRHVVKLDDKPTYRMRLDLNGKREFCESLPVTVGKGDVLAVSGS